MPLLVQVDAAFRVSPHSSELPIDLAQLCQPLRGDVAGQLQRQQLQAGENYAGLLHFCGVERPNTEASTHVGRQDSLADQTEQGFTHWRPADPQFSRKDRILDPGAWGNAAPIHPLQNLAMDLVSKRRAGYDFGSMVKIVYCIQYSLVPVKHGLEV
jgi:hypothetical protein